MTLVDHLKELRRRLLISFIAVGLVTLIVGIWGYHAVFDILRQPYCDVPVSHRSGGAGCDLIFGCQELVDFIAQTCTLRPGDLILTGTPSGVGMGLNPPRFLNSGDTIRIEIESLGVIEHAVG